MTDIEESHDDTDYIKQRAEETEQFKHIDESDLSLSPWSLLSCDNFAIDDVAGVNKSISNEEAGNMLQQKQNDNHGISVKPYIKLRDLNNSKEEPYLNKPKPAVEIGLKIEF